MLQVTRICIVCENAFLTTHSHKKCCSKECSSAQYKKMRHENYIKNIEDRKSANKLWAEANPEKVRQAKALWATRNRDKIAEKRKENKDYRTVYRTANRHKFSFYEAKRRAKLETNLSEFDRFVCEQAYELAQLRTNIHKHNWHVDHIVPLAKEGTHTADNLQVILAKLNMEKGARHSTKYKWSDNFYETV